jgi:hypothetical protein
MKKKEKETPAVCFVAKRQDQREGRQRKRR